MTNNLALPPQAIAEFQSIYQKLHGIKLTKSEAEKRAHNFLGLFHYLTQPLKTEEM